MHGSSLLPASFSAGGLHELSLFKTLWNCVVFVCLCFYMITKRNDKIMLCYFVNPMISHFLPPLLSLIFSSFSCLLLGTIFFFLNFSVFFFQYIMKTPSINSLFVLLRARIFIECSH